jgi:hypothetical protein
LRESLSQSIAPILRASQKYGPIDIGNIIVSTTSAKIESLAPQDMDEWVGKQIFLQGRYSSQNGQYAVAIIINPSIEKPVAIIGSRRHAWIEVQRIEDAKSLVVVLAAQLRHMLLNEVNIANLQKHSYRLTFSLLNEDPSATVVSWNFTQLENCTFPALQYYYSSGLFRRN